MSDAPNFGKPFEELTEAEVEQLDRYDWSAAQIMAAISMALREHDMEAVAGLMQMLAVKDPSSAQMILDALELTQGGAA
jgi:hypothetical protein